MRRRQAIGPAVIAAVAVVALVVAVGAGTGAKPASPPGTSPGPIAIAASGAVADPGASGGAVAGPGATADPTARPTVAPVPKHELFGFVPYWEMNDGIADHLERTPLTTLALFSVTNTKTGKINTGQTGYKRITGPIGKRLIREAHARGIDVQLVYTSFGNARNERLLGSPAVQAATIEGLVSLAAKTGVDGINVDIEQIGVDLVPAYGVFVGRLREALRAKVPDGQVSAATGGGLKGAPMAAAAAIAGADRIFLMGYDYHYSASDVGASAPMDRRDGEAADLPWSLDLYAALGVPAEKTILGLPLYGMRWRVAGPEIGAPRLGNGAIWVPADNPKFLANPPAPPVVDDIEIVEVYAVAPTVSPKPGDSRATAGWQAIYVDSPRTLRPKLALADERGLAGAGFWAIGYERGLAGYRDMMKDYRAGKIE